MEPAIFTLPQGWASLPQGWYLRTVLPLSLEKK